MEGKGTLMTACQQSLALTVGGALRSPNSRRGPAGGGLRADAASQRAIGIGVIGGILAATLLSVMWVPAFFV